MIVEPENRGDLITQFVDRREEERLTSGFYRTVPVEELDLIRTKCADMLSEINIHIPELQNSFFQEGMTDESLCSQLMWLNMCLMEKRVDNEYDDLTLRYCSCWLMSRSITRVNCVETNTYLYTHIDYLLDMCGVDFSFFVSGSDVINGDAQPSVLTSLEDIFAQYEQDCNDQ